MTPTVRWLRKHGCGLALALSAATAAWPAPAHAQTVDVRYGYMARKAPPPPAYEIFPVPEDEGLAGAEMAVGDNNASGRFLNQNHVLDAVALEGDQDPVAAARDLVSRGARFLVIDLAASELLRVADALAAEPVVLFNATAPDQRLRAADCRRNVFHTAPSRAMLTDGLAQFLAFKRWRKLFLVVGPQEGDRLYAESVKASAKKFGLQITAEKPWEFGPLARAKADGPTSADALVFTRGVDYEIAIVADEAGDFGPILAYRTWDPRLVAGTQGLTVTTWAPVLEAWGAAQAQNRFRRAAKRPMRARDHQVWMAIRSVGETVAKIKSAEPERVRAHLVGPDFTLPIYKGVAASFRPWDQQLRQPLIAVQPEALVTVVPEKGFLHQRTPLDTLGSDEAEKRCTFR